MQSIPIKKYKKPYSGMNEYINAAKKKTYIQAVNVVSYTKRGYLEEKKKKVCFWLVSGIAAHLHLLEGSLAAIPDTAPCTGLALFLIRQTFFSSPATPLRCEGLRLQLIVLCCLYVLYDDETSCMQRTIPLFQPSV